MKGIFFVVTLLAAPSASADGREIWMGTCQACHAEALSGAPLITDKTAWAPRLAKGKEALYRSALNGFVGAKGTEMPARGGNSSLSDEQVKAAVDYMVSKQGEGQ
jgi:cytochrome c5